MRSIKSILITLMLFFMGCELDLHNHSYDNPFDVDAYSEDDFSPPAIIFSPNTVNVKVGEMLVDARQAN